MHHHYDDIRSRIAEPPKWFDEDGVPRYCDFDPKLVADIYATEVVLLAIACQNCARPFDVAMSWKPHERIFNPLAPDSLTERVTTKTIHYGDPPNIGCCRSGPTMNSEPRSVLQFWRLAPLPRWEWTRVTEMEVLVEGACDGLP